MVAMVIAIKIRQSGVRVGSDSLTLSANKKCGRINTVELSSVKRCYRFRKWQIELGLFAFQECSGLRCDGGKSIKSKL